MSMQMKTHARIALHICLFIGCSVFLIPFLWQLLTSMKEDEELVPDRLRILPTAPEPRAASPYVDQMFFGDMKRPDAMPGNTWDRLLAAIKSGLRESIEKSDVAGGLPIDRADAIKHLVAGLWHELLGVLPNTLWKEGDDRILDEIAKASTPKLVTRVFDKIYRRACISPPTLRKLDFVEYAPGSTWEVVEGDLTLAEPYNKDDKTIRDLHYKFGSSDTIKLKTSFELPFGTDNIKQICIPVRADRSCHRLRTAVIMKGKRYEAEEDFVLVGSRWSEIIFQ